MDFLSKKYRFGFLKSTKAKIVLGIIALLIVIRLLLPYIALHFANKKLANMKGYYGHVDDIDIALFRGAYVLNDLYLNKVDTLTLHHTDFFDCKSIDLSVEWRALFNGRIVGELTFNEPVLRFVKDRAEPGQLQKDTNDFRQLLKSFMPLKVNRFEVNSGVVEYIDYNSKPAVNIEMTEVWILAENLTNASKQDKVLPSTVIAKAKVYEGIINFNMKLDPLAEYPTLDMNLEWKDTDLPKLNDFFQAYANFDVNQGRFGLYTEVAFKNGKYKGYVKPIIKDLDVLGPEDKEDNLLQKFWEGVAGTTGLVFTNMSEDQVATKVLIEGSFEDKRVNVWYAIVTLFRNAFVQALRPSIDNEINLSSIKKADKKNAD